MHLKKQYSLLAVLISSLLSTACVSISSTSTTTRTASNQANTQVTSKSYGYRFPPAIYGGYWAMKEKVADKHVVVEFKEGYSLHHKFICKNNGDFYKTETKIIKLVPSDIAMNLVVNGKIISNIATRNIIPKRSLILVQRHNSAKFRAAYPNGINYNYLYSNTLKPICN